MAKRRTLLTNCIKYRNKEQFKKVNYFFQYFSAIGCNLSFITSITVPKSSISFHCIFFRNAFQRAIRAASVAKLSVNNCNSGLYVRPRLSKVALIASYKVSSDKSLFVRS